MGDATVIIRRQLLEVEVQGTQADGLTLQQRLPGVCVGVLSSAIEAALGPIDPGDRYIGLDRLVIDVTLASIDGLDGELARAVQREMAEVVQCELEKHGAQPPPPGPTVSGEQAPGELGGGGTAERRWAPGALGGVRHRTFDQTVDAALDAFLRTGRLPWSFRVTRGQTLEQMVRDSWRDRGGQSDPPPPIRPRLRSVLTHPKARERLAIQFTPGFVAAVLRVLSPPVAALVTQVEAVLGEAGPASAARGFIRQVRVTAIEAAATGSDLSLGCVVSSAWTALSPAGQADRALAARLERAWPGSTQPAPTEPGRSGPGRWPTGSTSAPSPSSGPGVGPSGPAVLDGGESGGVLVDGAGIVLLHPFLPRFFEGLGVAAGDEMNYG
jgi:hypothetical protein